MAARKRTKRPQRSTYGEGSIFQDKAGRWYYQPPAANKERFKPIRCLDADNAQLVKRQWLESREAKRNAGIDPHAVTTFHGWMSFWWKEHKAPKLAETTRRACEVYIRMYILGLIRDAPIEQVSSDALVVWRNLLSRNVSAYIARRTYGLLSEALERAVASGKLARNPAAAVDPPKAPRSQPKDEDAVLTEAQFGTVLAAVEDEWRTLIYLAGLAGFRRGEGLGLLWSDFDPKKGRLTIAGQVQTYGKEATGERETIRIDDTKGHRARTIALPWPAVAMLEAQRRVVYTRQLRAGPDWQDKGLVFPDPVGAEQKPDTVHKRWDRLLARLSLPAVTFHSLRNLAITRMSLNGVSTRVLKEIAGHALDTHERYIKVTDADVRQALERAMAAMGKDEEGRAAK